MFTQVLVNKYSTTITAERSRVKQLEVDMNSLSDDISTLDKKVESMTAYLGFSVQYIEYMEYQYILSLFVQADKRATETNKALAEVEKTHTRAKTLDTEIRNLLIKIQGTGKPCGVKTFVSITSNMMTKIFFSSCMCSAPRPAERGRHQG